MGNEGTIESELNTGHGEEMRERGDEGKLMSFLLSGDLYVGHHEHSVDQEGPSGVK